MSSNKFEHFTSLLISSKYKPLLAVVLLVLHKSPQRSRILLRREFTARSTLEILPVLGQSLSCELFAVLGLYLLSS